MSSCVISGPDIAVSAAGQKRQLRGATGHIFSYIRRIYFKFQNNHAHSNLYRKTEFNIRISTPLICMFIMISAISFTVHAQSASPWEMPEYFKGNFLSSINAAKAYEQGDTGQFGDAVTLNNISAAWRLPF